jgi:hypothetical protein
MDGADDVKVTGEISLHVLSEINYTAVAEVINERKYLTVWTYASVEVQFQALKTRPPFNNEAKRLELLKRLNAIPGVSIPSEAIARRPSIQLSQLKDPDSLKLFLDAMDWAIQECTSA